MSRAARSAVTAFVILLVVGIFWPTEPSDLGADSYGRTGHGQRALFELFTALDLPVGRSIRRPEALDPEATIWWIQPWRWCSKPVDPDDEGRLEELVESDAFKAPPGPPEAWLRAGGTAVVFLPSWLQSGEIPWRGAALEEGNGPPRCEELAGVPLPKRLVWPTTEDDEASDPLEGDAQDDEAKEVGPGVLASRWWRRELDRTPVVGDYEPQAVSLRDGPVARVLPMRPLLHFDLDDPNLEIGDFEVVGHIDGEPFVLETGHGNGRLIVIADAGFVMNRWLDVGDAAPLALDLVRAYGPPLLDERVHGYSDAPTLAGYLAGSPAMPVFLGLAMMGLLIWAHGGALPGRQVAEHDPSAPALEPFVDSLAELYSRSKDFGALGVRYRELSFSRIRRHLGWSPEVPGARIVERLKRDPRFDGTRLRWLEEGTVEAVVNEADLRAATSQLDALVEEVCR